MSGPPNYKQESIVNDLYPIARTGDLLNALAGAVTLEPPIFQRLQAEDIPQDVL